MDILHNASMHEIYEYCTLTKMIHHLTWAMPLEYSNIPNENVADVDTKKACDDT